jgi:hypothetical protein
LSAEPGNALVPAADQMLGDNLRGLHIIRADKVDIIEIAGAGGKHQRHTDLRGAIAQFAAFVDSTGNNHPVYALRNQGFKALTHFFHRSRPG